MESLSDYLKSLGVNLGEQGIQKKQQGPWHVKEKIEDYVEGKEVSTNFGDCFVVNTRYSLEEPWGDYPVYAEADHSMLLHCAKLDSTLNQPLNRMVFMDTETTGLSGGSGTLAFMVGLGYYTPDSFELYQYFLRTPEEERAMLVSIDHLMAEQNRDIVVSYNGKSFDTPLLNTRYVINQLDSPFKNANQIDLLHFARRLWKKRLPSRTLGFVENEILGLHRSEEEVPGWMAPELYYEYLREGKAAGVSQVFYHNAVDIVSLGVLEIHMAQLLTNPVADDGLHGLDQLAIAKMMQNANTNEEQVLQLYGNALNKPLPEKFSIEGLLEFGNLLKRRGDWKEAIQIWEKAVNLGCLDACEELAKYYEHQVKDYETGMKWVNQGFTILETYPKHQFRTRQLKELYQHRLERLLTKWQKEKET